MSIFLDPIGSLVSTLLVTKLLVVGQTFPNFKECKSVRVWVYGFCRIYNLMLLLIKHVTDVGH